MYNRKSKLIVNMPIKLYPTEEINNLKKKHLVVVADTL